VVLAELGRLERTTGHPDDAMDLFRQALDIPGIDFAQDTELVKNLTQELGELETAGLTPMPYDSETSEPFETSDPPTDWSNDPVAPPPSD